MGKNKCNDNDIHMMMFKHIDNALGINFNYEMKELDLTKTQTDLIRFIHGNPGKNITQKDIEEGLKLKNPTITGVITRMEEKGFVKTMTDLDDKRCKLICLTEKAYKIENILKIHLESMNNKLIKGLNEEQILKLNEIIDIILSNMNDS